MDDPGVPRAKKTSRLGTIALVVVLLGLLVAATLFAIRSWTSIEGPPLPGVGYLAMTIGVLFSLLVGIALMTLLFYSSRHGYDERVQDYSRADTDREPQ
jgi:fatty acid desaturase